MASCTCTILVAASLWVVGKADFLAQIRLWGTSFCYIEEHHDVPHDLPLDYEVRFEGFV
jgi:hypothetical protein